MPRRDEHVERIEAALSPLGPVWARSMFGGFGVYLDAVMFGLISDGVLYLKVDEVNRGDYEAAGLGPFQYVAKGRPMSMSYHRAPEPLEDWDALEPWAAGSLAAARRAAATRKPRRRRPPAWPH